MWHALQDVPHTFANHPWLHEPDGQAALRRVLAAYSVHNPAVGYCRSMNQILALLLVALNRCGVLAASHAACAGMSAPTSPACHSYREFMQPWICNLCWPYGLAELMPSQ